MCNTQKIIPTVPSGWPKQLIARIDNSVPVLIFMSLFLSLGPSQFQGSLLVGLLFICSISLTPAAFVRTFTNGNIAWLSLLLFLLLGVALSEWPSKSLKGAYDFIRSVLVFAAAVALLPRYDETKLLAAMLQAVWGVAIILLGLYFWVVLEDETSWQLRDNVALVRYVSGIHEFANVAAMALLTLILLWSQRPQYRTYPVFLLTGTMCFLLLMSDSRGAYFALMACAIYAWSVLRSKHLAAFTSIAVITVAFFIYFSFFYNLTTIADWQIPLSFLDRIRLFQGTWASILKAPFFGYGLNSFKFADQLSTWDPKQIMPHNIFLELLFCSGIVGSGFLFAGLVLLGKNSKKAFCLSHGHTLANLGQCVLVYTFVRGLTELRLGYKVYVTVLLGIALIKCSQLVSSTPPQTK